MVLFAFSRHALSAVARSNFAIGAIVLALPLNVLANHVFMGGAFGWPGMGVAGAGLASLVVAIGLGGAVTAFLFLSPSFDRYRAPVMPPVFVLPELAALVRPAALMGLAAIAETGPFLGATVLVGIVAADDLIAHGLAFRAMAVCYLLLAGLGQAVTLRIACLRGRSALRREAHALRMTAALGLALIAGILTLFVFNPDAIALAAAGALGSVDAAPVAGTADLLPLTGLALAAAVPAHLVSAGLRARGEALAALVVFAIGHGGVGLLSMSFLGIAGFGAAGIWSGLALGATVGSAWGVWHLRPRSALADGVSAGRRVMLMSGKGAS
jgi:MATE family multidrug resistance protein